MNSFPLSRQILYATGMMGWSIMVNLIGVMLVYFYIPPDGSGLNVLVSQRTYLGIFTIMALITAGGRLSDAFYDPFIGRYSDKFKSKLGRRRPFMLFSVLPSVLFCILLFVPLTKTASSSNAIWLAFTLTLFFMATTTYVIPYYSLLPELATTNAAKVKLSSFQQVGYVLGMIIASLTNNISAFFASIFPSIEKAKDIEFSVAFLAIVGGLAMIVPVISIDEKKLAHAKPSSAPLLKAIKESLSSRNFIYFLVATFSYSTALNLILTGLMYFVTVLCNIPPSQGAMLVAFMVLLSLCFYPLINYLAKQIGEKKIMVLSFLILGFVFAGISLIGKLPINPKLQLYLLLAITSFPLASLGILPTAILARIVSEDRAKTGDSKEGTFFAVNYFSVKLGQTIGITLFAMLTIYGKDSGHDWGLRLSGICGFILCLLAAIIFTRFKNKE